MMPSKFICTIKRLTFYDLRDSEYQVNLPAGDYSNKFEIVFSSPSPHGEALSISDNELNGLQVYYSNDSKSIVLINPKLIEIKSIELYNILGQSIYVINRIKKQEKYEHKLKSLTSRTYALKMHSVSASVSKKVLVK